MKEKKISIRGAKVNNLKNIDLDIPRNKFVVITGLSGSGKSSLAFDTLYAEGQRRYVESLSSYARQFMGRMKKPDVKSITGIPPAIAIEQQILSRNPRSTVGTVTEIYEYLKLLFARIGHTYSPVSGQEVKRHDVKDVLRFIMQTPEGERVYVLAPMVIPEGRSVGDQLLILRQQGFNRMVYDRQLFEIDDVIKFEKEPDSKKLYVMVDRFKSDNLAAQQIRVTDAVNVAFSEGKGVCAVLREGEKSVLKSFSNFFEADGMTFEEPTVNMFSFNNPYGACKTCSGTGMVEGVNPDLVFPDRSLSVAEDAVACWHGEIMSEWKRHFIRYASKLDFPVYRAIDDLTEEEYNLLWYGDVKHDVHGITQFFDFVAANTYKIQFRVMQARYRGRELCPECHGTRLRKDAQYVKVNGKSIAELQNMPVSELKKFFENFEYQNDNEKEIAKILMRELTTRIGLLDEVGLGYLTLDRNCSTLSGGESQRINLSTSLGSSLVGSMYILDEPSIGLHSRDTEQLIGVLKHLRDIGNTVIVVEHDEDIIRAADYIIDIGPRAGRLGGEVVFEGHCEGDVWRQGLSKKKATASELKKSLTLQYLNGSLEIAVPETRRHWRDRICIKGAYCNNLKDVDIDIPLNVLMVVTGVSGSGKTSLVKGVLYDVVKKRFDDNPEYTGQCVSLSGDISRICGIELVDQNPIGRSTRSNPATYMKAYDEIRQLYASQPLSKARGYKAGFFSFNTEGGRCETCEGEGYVTIGMQFMSDLHLVCEECHGTRFKEETLEVKYKGKNVSEVLDMTVDQAIEFFSPDDNTEQPLKLSLSAILSRLQPLQDVGLGYLKLGQSSSSLSGGEAQRVKLASFLVKGSGEQPRLFIFDEPSTGLHFHDIKKLLQAFDNLIANGHSIVVIEHHPDIIKTADWVIDLGPEGGDKGGNVVFAGTPEDLAKCKQSYTAKHLRL